MHDNLLAKESDLQCHAMLAYLQSQSVKTGDANIKGWPFQKVGLLRRLRPLVEEQHTLELKCASKRAELDSLRFAYYRMLMISSTGVPSTFVDDSYLKKWTLDAAKFADAVKKLPLEEKISKFWLLNQLCANVQYFLENGSSLLRFTTVRYGRQCTVTLRARESLVEVKCSITLEHLFENTEKFLKTNLPFDAYIRYCLWPAMDSL